MKRIIIAITLIFLLSCDNENEHDLFVAHPSSYLQEVGKDQSDHKCKVVLRYAGRSYAGDKWEVKCSSGKCYYVFDVNIDVSEEIPIESQVYILYHLTSDPKWWEVKAEEKTQTLPGYRSYYAKIFEHTFGPKTKSLEQVVLEMIAFVKLPDGTRLFDHNLYKEDFENLRLTLGNNFQANDMGICKPIVGTIWFNDDWSETTYGALRQGGYMVVNYDLDRLPDCRGTHNGFPAWDIVAYAKFNPSAEIFSGSVRQFVTENGWTTTTATEKPFVVKIPDNATSVELWFYNYTGAGSSCKAWDSNFGVNYRFSIWPSKESEDCKDIEKVSSISYEDSRMVVTMEHCVEYNIDSNQDEDSCEFYVDGFGNGYMGHYGIPFKWLVAYLKTEKVKGEILGVGMYVKYHDAKSLESGQRYVFGVKVYEGTWKTGIPYYITQSQINPGVDIIVDQFAFFVDVKTSDDKVVRLWKSRHGLNYKLDDAFSLPTFKQSIPYGYIEWANEDSPVLESKRWCK